MLRRLRLSQSCCSSPCHFSFGPAVVGYRFQSSTPSGDGLVMESATETTAANENTHGFYDGLGFFEAPAGEAALPRVQPPAMTINLLPFQQEGVAWMMSREQGYSGGIMADHLGMGKTVQMIGLCLANANAKRKLNDRPAAKAKSSKKKTGGSAGGQGDVVQEVITAKTEGTIQNAKDNSKPFGNRILTVIKQMMKISSLGNVSKLNRPGRDLFKLSDAVEEKLKYFDSTYDTEVSELKKWIFFAAKHNTTFAKNAEAFMTDERVMPGDGSNADFYGMDTPEIRTLVVLPASLIHQWQSEITKKIGAAFAPSVYVYHGVEGKKISVPEIESYDFVLTSYETIVSAAEGCSTSGKGKGGGAKRKGGASSKGTLAENSFNREKAGPLFLANWKRIILDEAHNIRHDSTRRWKCIRRLQATKKWAVTATPLHNSIEDVQTLLEFTNTPRLPIWKKGGASTEVVLKDPRLQRTISRALSTVFLRRSPVMRRNGKTEVLVELPPKHEEIMFCDLGQEEQLLYNDVLLKGQQTVGGGAAQGRTMHMFAMMTRLRQVCSHKWLLSENKPGGSNAMGPDGLPITYLCGVCDEEASGVIITKCGHSFCRECLMTQFQDEAGVEKYEAHRLSEMSTRARVPLSAAHPSNLQEGQQGLFLAGAASTPKVARVPCPKCEEAIPVSIFTNGHISREHRVEALSKKDWTGSTKIDLILKLIQGVFSNPKTKDDKIVVFSQFTMFLDVVEIALQRAKVEYHRVDGESSLSERNSTITSFAGDSKQVLLASKMATGVGLNLTMANHVFVVDPWWNPAIEEQAVHRCHRIGQKKPVHITRLVVKGTIEEYCLEVCQRKKDFGDAVLAAATTDGGESSSGKSASRLSELMEKLHVLGDAPASASTGIRDAANRSTVIPLEDMPSTTRFGAAQMSAKVLDL